MNEYNFSFNFYHTLPCILGIVVQLLRVRARKWPIYPVQPVRRNTHNMTSNFYQKWALHTPVPQGKVEVVCSCLVQLFI